MDQNGERMQPNERLENGAARRPLTTNQARLRKLAISACLVAHIAIIFIWLSLQFLQAWCTVPPTPLKDAFGTASNRFYRYLMVTGTWQAWAMFSPNPAQVDAWYDARVKYRNGSETTWSIPRMGKLGYAAKYQQERWRKLMENEYNDYATPASASLGRQELAYLGRYIARRSYRTPTNPPVSIALVRHWREIAPPGKAMPPFKADTFLTYTLGSGDLN